MKKDEDEILSQIEKENIKNEIDRRIIRYEKQLSQLTEEEKEAFREELEKQWEKEHNNLSE